MQKLLYTKGLPASGKSTWVAEYLASNENSVVVSRDSIRQMLVIEYSNFLFGSSMERLVTDIENNAIDSAIKRGYTVIVDATNFRFTESMRREYEKSLGIPIRIIDFTSVPLEVCIERDAKRERIVGEDVIRSMHDKYLRKD